MTTKRTSKGLLAQMPKRARAVRHEVEKATRRAFERAIELLPPAPRKQVRELTHRIEKAGSDLQRRVERTRHDVEKQGERFVGVVADSAEKALTPLVRRFDVASRAELDRLRKRVAALEKRAEHVVKRVEHAVTHATLPS